MESTMTECSYWIASPSRRPLVSPYAMNENRATSRDCASGGSGVGGGAMATTRSASWAGPARTSNTDSELASNKTIAEETLIGCLGITVGSLTTSANDNSMSAHDKYGEGARLPASFWGFLRV